MKRTLILAGVVLLTAVCSGPVQAAESLKLLPSPAEADNTLPGITCRARA